MSLTLAVARGTGVLPHQTLEQEMTRLGLTITSACKIRTANPTQFEANGMTGDFAAFDAIGQEGQTFRPAETGDDVIP
jgi:hypothetical protein